ncbi:16S rRNA (adenine(1518)-N(6)/adenine(1519)-N(6))-dimethyltransferase RsmA [Leuconostocaceae bacterium ESL0958]|nr:16S rRNA (adenine(1518)-N(6)/adenine(1519)-N(6))-dimethyltransferase RsmA [Leuconostocaceae bacterium ESL0958]
MAERIKIATPARTQAILNKYGLRAKKKLGQNFLTDGNILQAIVQAAAVTDQDDIVEIGPGIGALTEYLALAAKRVLAFEIDTDMVRILAETLSPYDNVQVLEADILSVDLKTVLAASLPSDQPIKVVANLPYYITTPILMALVQADINWSKIVVMMQKEVADRLTAQPGHKDYGVLSIMLAYYANIKQAVQVPRTAFNPAPNVDSAVVVLDQQAAALPVQEPKQLFSLVKACFAHRRKSLWNNLQQRFGKDEATRDRLKTALAEAEIEASVRAERLTLNNFTQLYWALGAAGFYSEQRP